MRALPLSVAAGGAMLLALGCGGGTAATPSAPAGATVSPSAPLYDFTPGADSLVAMFTLTIDPATMSSTVTPVAGRAAQTQPPQAISYDLDIANFLRPDSFEVTAIGRDVDGNVVVDYNHRHPFRAPDFAAAISGQNRADLGYTGRLLILADSTSESYFGGSVDLDPTLVVGADGYFNTGDLLASTGHTNNTFPYMLLADDGKDNRVDGLTGAAISNGANPHGSYAAADGWQRANAGTGTGWTGFDYIHGGQGATNSFTLSAAALTAGPTEIDVAVLIKYTDPRGRGGRTLRFPPTAPDVTEFAYRLPYAALDASQVAITATDLEVNDLPAGDTASVTFEVRDWDANATAAADADLSDETDVSLIEPAAAGAPAAEIDAPFLDTTPVVVVPSGVNSGEPGDEIPYGGTLTNTLGTAAVGSYFACVRVIDPSDATTDSNYHFGVDPTTIVPSASRSLAERSYQVVPIDVVAGAAPPTITAVNPIGVAGCASTPNVVFTPTFTGAPITTWAWDFGGGATPNTSAVEQPSVTLAATPTTYNGTVTATNASGSSAPFPFSFTVAAPWTHYVMDQGTTQNRGYRGGTTMYDGKPAVVVHELSPVPGTPSSAAMRISIANNANPQGVADWTSYSLPSFPIGLVGAGVNADITNLNGRLAVTYKLAGVHDLMCTIATVVAPTVPTATDWSAPHVIDAHATNDVGRDACLIVHNNLLAVGYYDATALDFKLARATVAVPAATGDWAVHAVDSATSVGAFSSMLSYDDGTGARLVAAYLDSTTTDLKIAKALTLTPASNADWQFHQVDPASDSGRFTGMTAFNVAGSPRLAVSYGTNTSSQAKVAISTVPSPTSDIDWRKIILDTNVSLQFPFGTDVAFANGRLVVFFVHSASASDSDLGTAVANIADPITVSDFTLSFADTDLWAGAYPAATVLNNGSVGCSYRLGFPNGTFVGSTKWITRSCN